MNSFRNRFFQTGPDWHEVNVEKGFRTRFTSPDTEIPGDVLRTRHSTVPCTLRQCTGYSGIRALLLTGFFLLSGIHFTLAADLGGLSAGFSPNEVRPGDLLQLSIEMDRPDYGQFTLELPRHPRLHLVSREKIPPAIKDGRYIQSERLMLQALSSGPLTFSGIKAELTEAGGSRTLELPELSLNVLAFETADSNETAEPLPKADEGSTNRSNVITNFLLMTMIGILVYLIIRDQNTRANSEAMPPPEVKAITEEDFETLLEQKGNALSASLRADLEAFLYASKGSAEIDVADLKERLSKEMAA